MGLALAADREASFNTKFNISRFGAKFKVAGLLATKTTKLSIENFIFQPPVVDFISDYDSDNDKFPLFH